MASVQLKHEICVFTGFFSTGIRSMVMVYVDSRAPLLPPLIPTLPVRMGNMAMARAVSSPLA